MNRRPHDLLILMAAPAAFVLMACGGVTPTSDRSADAGRSPTASVPEPGSTATTPLPQPSGPAGPEWIAFTRWAKPGTGQPTLWIGKIDGTEFRPVGDQTGYFPDWSPDRSRLLFDFFDPTGRNQIATIRPDGTGFTQLTDSVYNEAADYSPDGSTIVFDRATVKEDDPEFATTLWTMDADGKNPKRLLERARAGFDYEGEYSPDGTHITFVRFDAKADKSAVYVVASDGRSPRRVSPWDTYVEHPRWSTDGELLIYNIEYKVDLDDPRNGIWTVPAAGGAPTNLLGGAPHPFKPDFSPDGSRILFGCLYRGGSDELCVMNADGTDVQRLTMTPTFENHPVWD